MIRIKDLLTEYMIPFEENISLKKKTWIKTGGVVSLWITPISIETLKKAVEILCDQNFEFELVGHTSNIYYVDHYNPRIIISTLKVNQYEVRDNYIECACGTPVAVLAKYCVECGYKGYYGLVNLPGTVGAAICNNSSCYDCSISEHLIEVMFYNLDTNKIETLLPEDFYFSYRNSKLKKKELRGVILSVKLDKNQGYIEEEKEKSNKVACNRKATQEAPAFTLGSIYAGLVPKKDIRNYIARGG